MPAYIGYNLFLWFKAVEVNFAVHKRTKEEKKSALVIAALPEKQLQSVSYLIDTNRKP